MEWLTTSTILQRLGDFDDGQGWRQLTARFQQPIVRFAKRQGLSDLDAEDAAQETLLAFTQGFREGRYDRSRGRLSHWLFGIAYRQILNHGRRNARNNRKIAQVENETRFWADLPDQPEVVASWDVEWEQTILEQCLEQVRREVEPITFRAFHLVVSDERSPAQAADLLGVPIKTVYNAKHRVLHRIRELRGEIENAL